MSMQKTKRPLSELEARALPGLQKLSGNLQKEVIEIAAKKSPTKTKDLVEAILRNSGFAPNEAEDIAKCVRWLAVAKRDKEEEHGFEQIVAKLTPTE